MASPYEMRAITDALQAIMEQLNRIEDRIDASGSSSSVAELNTAPGAATTGWQPKASDTFGDAPKPPTYEDVGKDAERPDTPTKAPETTDAPAEAAPEAKPETAGNTETVGTSRIGAE
jgi:hypothetical protein